MYQAAIVEDEKPVADYIKTILSNCFQKNNLCIGFDCFPSGTPFLEMLEMHYHYDIILLDIEMPEMDGISVCRRVRSILPDALVVFISNKEELVFSTFEVQPFRFIRKSQFEHMAEPLTKALKEELFARNRQIIQITEPYSRDIFSFDVRKIQYIEAQGKKSRIVTDEDSTVVSCLLMDLEKQLQPYHFIRVHRSYLVNCSCIFHIQKSWIILNDKTEIPISRGKQEEIKQLFLQYCMS